MWIRMAKCALAVNYPLTVMILVNPETLVRHIHDAAKLVIEISHRSIGENRPLRRTVATAKIT